MKKVLFFVIGFSFSNGLNYYNIDGLVNWVIFDKDIFLDICLRNLKEFCIYFIDVDGNGLLF